MVNVESRHAAKEQFRSDAFKAEYKKDISESALINDIVAYLGEYRFKLPNYFYSFDFADGQLIDPNRRESMEIISQRAIDLKNSQGKSSIREQAEKIGFQKLDKQLRLAKNGDTIIWMSPMGPKSDGYGNYGFVFFGKVDGEGYYKKISMTAKRIESPTIEQFNKTKELLIKDGTIYQKAEDFLSNPTVLGENLSEVDIDSTLRSVFAFKPSEKAQETFQKVIDKMFSLIVDLAHLLKSPWKTKEEKIKGVNSIENYAIKLRKDYEGYRDENAIYIKGLGNNLRIYDIVADFGHKPPVVAGSCGSTGASSNTFSTGSSLNNLFEKNSGFCKECQGDSTDNHYHCPKCNKEYSDETNKSPEERTKQCGCCGFKFGC